ncbi:MAG: DUF4363 family protein [Christensenellaceae bacterium]|jgi:hypothetical protein|nr:DUF4363 family protein [Christensenellaceae bacterium]
MTKRSILIIVIIVTVIAAAIWEQLFLNETYNQLKSKIETLTNAIYAVEDDETNTDYNMALAQDLYEFWLSKEKILLYLIKHTEIYQTSDAIIYAKNFIEFDDKKETMNALSKLQYLVETRTYYLGSSSQNFI